MKKILLGLATFAAIIIQSQVIIGPTQESVSNKALLSFTTTNQGIVLPLVNNNVSVTHTAGTLLYNRADRQVQMYTDNGWASMTGDALANSVVLPATGPGTESSIAKVIIGADTSNAAGALVLESNDKVLILPKVDEPYNKIVNPQPGTIVYGNVVKGGVEKTYIFIFNGESWYTWKAGI